MTTTAAILAGWVIGAVLVIIFFHACQLSERQQRNRQHPAERDGVWGVGGGADFHTQPMAPFRSNDHA